MPDYASAPPSSPTIWIDIPAGRLAAQDEGPRDGSPILLVHSAIVNRRSWDLVVPRLLDAGYRVIRYDMRGFGDSISEDVEFMAHEDLLAVLDHFGLERVAVAGNSMGAVFSLDALVHAPERFVAYVWVGGGINGYDDEPSDPVEDALFEAESTAEKEERWDDAAELDTRIWVDGWRDGANEPSSRVDPDVRAAIKAWDRQLLEPGRVYGKRKEPGIVAYERLGTIEQPTLVVIGELDTVGTRAAADVLAERVPGARLVRVPNVAHIVGMEAPDRLAELILEHLAPLPRWA